MPTILRFLGYYPFPAPGTVGARLLRVRREQGWSAGQAAGYLGVDRTTWQRWEHGELVLFRAHRAKVAQLLGVNEGSLSIVMHARWRGKHRRWE